MTFTVMSNTNGAGATFSANQSSVKQSTNASGQAVAPTLTATARQGRFTVIASVAGSAAKVAFDLAVT